MNVKDIMQDVLARLGIERDYDMDALTYDMPVVNKIYPAVRRVVSELCEWYQAAISESVMPIGGAVAYDALSKPIYKLIGIKSKGKSVPYTLIDGGIRVGGDDSVSVKYYYRYCLSDSGEADIPAEVGVGSVALGVLAEYYYVNAMYDDADIADKRYKESLARIKQSARLVHIKKNNTI